MFYICADSKHSHKLNNKHGIMLEFEVNGKLGKRTLGFPTSLKDLDGGFIKDICGNIHIADDHSLVCLCYRETVGNVLFTANSKKKNSITTAVVPMFVKCGKTNNQFINNLDTGNVLVVPASDLALGYHVKASGNSFTIDYLLKASEGDTTLYQRALNFKDTVYFIEFKIIPNCNIKGYYSIDVPANNTKD